MKLTFLGTGTSAGVPVIECDCKVCVSGDSRNKRLRASAYIEAAGTSILIDASPDFRQQALRYKMPRIDAVLFTHAHADHVFGFDDIRRYNTIQDGVIPAYASPHTVSELKRIFDYITTEPTPGFYRPLVDFREITGAFKLGGLGIEPLDVEHGPNPAHGFLFEEEGKKLCYLPDCHSIKDELVEKLKGIDVMILDALRLRPHNTHLMLEDSVEILKRIGATRSYIVHMCHDLDHEETQKMLPESMHVSYDGLVVEL